MPCPLPEVGTMRLKVLMSQRRHERASKREKSMKVTVEGVAMISSCQIPTFAESRGVDATASGLRDEKRSL